MISHNLNVCLRIRWLLFVFSHIALMQDWTCTSSTCGHHTARTRGFCLSCLCMDGLAPSMSSTRFCHFSHRTRVVLHLRSYVRPYRATVSQKPLINKVDYSKYMHGYISVSDAYRCAFCPPLGFDSLAAARIFLTLMERLGFSQFYVQGGDWGSLVTTNMSQMKPQ